MNDSSCIFEIIEETMHSSKNFLSVKVLCEIAGVSRSGYYAIGPELHISQFNLAPLICFLSFISRCIPQGIHLLNLYFFFESTRYDFASFSVKSI